MASKLQKAIQANIERGGETYFLTLTVPNDRSLKDQYDLLSKSYRKFAQALQRDLRKRGVERSGLSWSYDATFRGPSAKPHLHLHLVLFLSSPVELFEDQVFQLWEKQVHLVAGREIYLSRKAFYARPVRSHEASAKYVFKHLKSSLEISNSKGKSCGFWSLLEKASKGDQAAIKAHTDTLSSFFNRSWSHLGKYASELAGEGEDQEQPVGEGGASGEDVFVLEVPPVVHGLLLDSGIISLVFGVMKASSGDFRRRDAFKSGWTSFLQEHESIKDGSYDSQLLFVRRCLLGLLGSLMGHDQGFHRPEMPPW